MAASSGPETGDANREFKAGEAKLKAYKLR